MESTVGEGSGSNTLAQLPGTQLRGLGLGPPVDSPCHNTHWEDGLEVPRLRSGSRMACPSEWPTAPPLAFSSCPVSSLADHMGLSLLRILTLYGFHNSV